MKHSFRVAAKAFSVLVPYWMLTGCTMDPQEAISPAREKNATAKIAASSSPLTIDQFIGANAFIDDPIDKMQAVGFIREYHNWNWDEGSIWSGGGNWNYPGYPKNQIKWAPSEGGWWNFDTYYRDVRAAGLNISPCIKESVPWIHGGIDLNNTHHKPTDEKTADPTNPQSYEKKAHHMFQFAARYGSSTVADSKLTLAADQSRYTGLSRIQYMEDWNEPDNNWSGPEAYFSPQQYAAMASANYDGHGGTMVRQNSDGTTQPGTFGVKSADPNMKLVMGGIAFLSSGLDRIQQMKTWFETNRADKKFALDVINLHHYAWKDEALNWQGGGPAKSPEADNFKARLEKFTQYRDQYLPGVEVWVSEFGWDTHPNSPLRAPKLGSNDHQEVQGQWLVRAYLAFAAAKVDRAQMFMLRDVDPNNSGHFNTCGLVGPKGTWTPKKSWYYVSTMKHTLKNMVFLGEVAATNSNVLIYKFKEAGSSRGAYAVWCKTSSNHKVSSYSLQLSGTPTMATRVDLVVGDADGKPTPLTISGNKVAVGVSERPIFITVDNIQ